MPAPRYYLVRHETVWFIKFEDEEYGPYETEAEAVNLAMDAVEKLGHLGENADLQRVGEMRRMPHH